jgi:DNA replication protein DnaC
LLLDQEASYRRDRRLHFRLRYARLRHQAAVEDVDYRAARGLDRTLFQKLAEGAWIDAHENLILCGPTGVGKSWLASALGHKACRDNRSVLYQRIPKLFADLTLARGDGRYARIQRALGRCTCSSLTIGVLSRSTPPRVTTSSRFSKNATAADRRSSPAKSPSTNGTS